MNKMFNCCHGIGGQQGHWMCSTKEGGTRVDEEVIGEEGPAGGKSHHASGDAGGSARSNRAGRGGPPMPVGGPGGPEDEKETAKQRLQRLIRVFAHDAVGPGLEVEAQCTALAVTADCNGTMQAKLRMDRKLSRIEIWGAAAGSEKGEQCVLKVPLQQVKQITKRSGSEPGGVTEADGAAGGARTEVSSKGDTGDSPHQGSRQPKGGSSPAASPRSSATLCITRRPAASGQLPELRLTFDSGNSRDKAFTCLRIFQMSVDQSAEGHSREAESDTGCESTVTPTIAA
mmetsp:Transcript_76107/g.235657  ORF Transcript_76107/g.235657 Transcript_76107/m.235657 type:complete len:286 (+) Transcript_76107:136-993(+)